MKRSYLVVWTLALLGLWGCDPKANGIEGVSQPTGFAVIHSDYSSASIALLGPEGSIVKRRFVHSGSTFSGLESALSGDVVLPTASSEAGVLTYIERYGADTITRIDIEAGEVLSQLKAESETDKSGYAANPQDYLYVDANSAWITRYAPNTVGGDSAKDPGNDLLMIDPGAPKRTTTRIGFDQFNTTGMVTNPDTMVSTDVTIYANPNRMVMVGDLLVVGMDRFSENFDAIGSGMVAVVDLKKKTAKGLDLGELTNCGTVIPVQGDDTRAIVSCLGFYSGNPSDGVGLAILQNMDNEIVVEAMWRAAKHTKNPMAVGGVASLGGTKVVAVADGDFGDNPDRAYVVDIKSGDQILLAEAMGSYVLGSGYFIKDTETFLLPDASTDENGALIGGVRRFKLTEGKDPKELAVLMTDKTLPPRAIGPLF